MRRLAQTLALGLVAPAVAWPSPSLARPGAPGPSYSPEDVRAIELFGIHAGMEAGAACETLVNAGFDRNDWDGTVLDCSTFPEEGTDDSFLGRGPLAATPYGKVSSISLEYRTDDSVRRVRGISIYTDEKRQEVELEAASRADWGDPTYYADWAYTVLNYAETPEQADFDAMSDYRSCLIPGCRGREEAAACIPVLERFASTTMQVVVYDWGRVIQVRDDTGIDHRDLLREHARIRDGQSVYLCSVPTIH